MGCDTNITNTYVKGKGQNKNEIMNSYYRENIKNYAFAIQDVKSMGNNLKEVGNYPLKCFLVSVKSVPNLLKIILNTSTDGLIDLNQITEYNLETNIQIYDDFDTCKNIFENDKENNEFIIVSEKFLKNMEIKEGKEVKLEIENSQIKAIFEQLDNGKKKMIIKEKSPLIYHFIGYEGLTKIDKDELNASDYNEINQKDSFLLKSLIDCLTNIDAFKNIFITKEQIINNNQHKYPISYILLNIVKKVNIKNIKRKRKEFMDLYEILYEREKEAEPKSLIFSLIDKLSKEYNTKNNPILDLFGIESSINYICQSCNFLSKTNKNSSCLEFNLEKVRDFKSKSNDFYENIDIKDCFSYYEEKEKIESNYSCSKCNKEIVNSNKYYKIEIFPDILIIILDRQNKIKTNEKIEFNIEFNNNNESLLDLSNLSYSNNKIIYDLIGVFSYKNEIDDSNKFYSTVFCKMTNKWNYYDKYEQKEIEKMQIEIMHTPFMLFYVRK